MQNITYNQDNISILSIFCYPCLPYHSSADVSPPAPAANADAAHHMNTYIYLHTSLNIPCINANAKIFFIFNNYTIWLMFRASATYPYIFIARVATFPLLSDIMLCSCSYSYCTVSPHLQICLCSVGNGMYFTEHKQRALM